MNADDIKKLREFCERATPGPWLADLDQFSDIEGIVACVSNLSTGNDLLFTAGLDIQPFPPDRDERAPWLATDESTKNAAWALASESQALKDAQFIAAARTAVPALLDLVDSLQAQLAAITEARDKATFALECLLDEFRPLEEALPATSREALAAFREEMVALRKVGS